MDGLVYRTAKQDAADPDLYVLSDETVDRYGEVISVAGWDLENFQNNPIALFNHHSDAIVGHWENVRVEKKRLIGRLVMAEAGTSTLVDEVRRHRAQKNVRAVSVGFRDLEREPLNEEADPFWGPFRYLKQELVECSLVAVPANPNALQVSRSLSLPAAARQQLFGKLAREALQPAPTVPRQARQAPPASGKPPMNISKKIETTQAKLNQLRDQLTALNEKDDPTADDIALIDELPEQIEIVQADLERHKRVEKALATQAADPVDPTQRQQIIPPARPFRLPAKKVEPRDYFIRTAAVHAIAKIMQKPIEAVLAKMYGDDEATGWMVRAVTNPALTTVPGWAQELVQVSTAAFLDTLKPDTIYPVLRGRGLSFSFGPGAGTIRVPGRAATPTLAGAWVGEGQPIPVRRIGLISVLLGPKKLAVISTFSHELADYSTPNIESVVRDAMESDTALVIDTYLLDDQPATTVRPAGLRNGIAGLPPSALPDKTQAMIADIKALIGAIITVNGGRDVVVIMNTLQELGINFAQVPNGFLFPTTGDAGRRFNVTFASSTAVPVGMVLAVDAADFATASGDQPDFNVSDQATIHEEDTTPLPIAAGAGPTVANPTRSLWQTDTIGVRMRLPLNWSMRRPGMVSWMTGVTW